MNCFVIVVLQFLHVIISYYKFVLSVELGFCQLNLVVVSSLVLNLIFQVHVFLNSSSNLS